MTTASQDKITVPGDDRLTKLNVSTKTPFWTKIPIIKELRVAVGWQKGMLITGLAITAFFLLVALFAPLIAPYGHAQIKAADGTSFPAQAAPSAEHIWGTTLSTASSTTLAQRPSVTKWFTPPTIRVGRTVKSRMASSPPRTAAQASRASSAFLPRCSPTHFSKAFSSSSGS